MTTPQHPNPCHRFPEIFNSDTLYILLWSLLPYNPQYAGEQRRIFLKNHEFSLFILCHKQLCNLSRKWSVLIIKTITQKKKGRFYWQKLTSRTSDEVFFVLLFVDPEAFKCHVIMSQTPTALISDWKAGICYRNKHCNHKGKA